MDEERRKRQTFFNELETFFKKKWNTALKSPNLNGYQIDLYGLYKKVIALGGWNKVSTSNKWREIAQFLRLPKKCYGAEHATKMIYMKYLARFEQQQVFGEDHDEGNNGGIGGSRSTRAKGSFLSSGAPSLGGGIYPSFSRAHLPIPDGLRVSGGFATNLVRRGSYDRLIRSLQSGLPNEVDFALNLCLVMSNSSVSTNFANCQQASSLVDLLLAHIGFFDEDSLASYQGLYQQAWVKHSTDLKFVDFWRNSTVDDDDSGELTNLLNPIEFGPKFTNSEKRTLNLTQEIGAHNPVSQKIILAGTIFRNFSFDTDFRSTLSSNRTMLKYILMCINSKYAVLQNIGWDTLSNLSSELSLEPFDSSLTQILFRTLHKSLNSSDKFCIIRALETIGNLCSNENNESVLCEFLEPTVLRRLIALLAVKDIMMCVYLLECLYIVSEMGHVPCQRIAEQPKAIDTLISLVTVEAVSFGPSGLMGMKVVEFGLPQPQTAILPQPFRTSSTTPKLQSSLAMVTPPAVVAMATAPKHTPVGHNPILSAVSQQQGVPPPFMAKPVRLMSPNISCVATSSSIQQQHAPPVSMATAASLPTNHIIKEERRNSTSKKSSKKLKDAATNKVTLVKGTSGATPTVSMVTVPAAGCVSMTPPFRGPAVMVQQDQQFELVASNWLKQNCTAQDSSSTISRAELYTAYVHKIGQTTGTMAVSVNTFTTLIRQNFPSCQLRHVETVNCKTPLMHVEGLKYTPCSVAMPAVICQQQQPVAMTTTTPIKSPASNVASQHPLTQQILSQKSQFSPVPPSAVAVLGAASPAPSGANSPSVNSLPPSRARSDSIGTTTDSLSSFPGTPESASSSTKVGKTKNKSKKRKIVSPSDESPSKCNSDSLPGTTVAENSNCHLDVCHAAQEAERVVETGGNHEALIVRIENSVGSVLSKMIPSAANNEPSNHESFANRPNVNGRLESDSSPDNSLHSATSSVDCSNQQQHQPHQPNSNNSNSIIAALLNKKSEEKLLNAATNVNGIVKPTASIIISSNVVVANNTNISVTTNNDNNNSNEDCSSRTQSPSPDMEAMKLNLQKQQQNIQQLLMSTPPPLPPATEITTAPSGADDVSNSSQNTTVVETTASCSLNTTADDEILDSVVTAVVAERKRRINEQLLEGMLPAPPKPAKPKSSKKSKIYKKPPIAVDDQVVNSVVDAVASSRFFDSSASTSAQSTPPKKKSAKRKLSVDESLFGVFPSSDDALNNIQSTKKKKKAKKHVENVVNHVSGICDATIGPQTPPQQSSSSALAAFRSPQVPPSGGSVSSVHAMPVQYVATIQQNGATAQIVVRMPPPATGKLKYVCEWDNCEKSFESTSMVSYHVAKAHILSDHTVTSCKWIHCDKTPRLTWSLIAHVQDVHCNERVLRTSAIRRYEISLSGHSNIPEPKSPPPHPGYPTDAALAAIRRHALVGLTKDITEENEGPVTKSIRLASALTLRNLARYSSEGRHLLRKYENSLSNLAMSRLESCTALAQCLAELYSPVSQEVSNNPDISKSQSESR